MSYALTRYTGNNSTTTYTIGFAYRDKADLIVKVAGVAKSLTTDYTIPAGGTQIQFNSPPAQGAAILIQRSTSQTSRLVDYAAGAVFKESDLDTDSIQGFNMAQEAIDIANDSIAKDANNLFDATSTRIINVADPVDSQDAATKAFVQTVVGDFNNRYYGESATAPTSPSPAVGDLWYDSTNNVMKVYANTGWQTATSAVATSSNRVNYVVGTNSGSYTGSTTTFPVVYDSGFVDVYLNGAKLVVGSDFTATNGSSVILSTAASSGDKVDIVAYGTAALTNVNTVAGDIANINTVAGNIGSVTAVANNSSNVNTVSGAIANVNTTASNIGAVNAVANNETNINAVNTNASNINTVAGVSSNVTTVAGISSDVTAVAGDASDIGTVAGISSDVSTVAGISSNVTAVAGDQADIGTVATDLNLGGNSKINTVGNNITSVNTVSSNINSVNTVNSNITSVQNAANNANSAATSASASQSSANNSASSASAASTAQSAAEAARDAALSALDNFDDRYLGVKSSAPTLDNDGNALVSGALYFDSTSNAMKVYDGSQWLSAYANLDTAMLKAGGTFTGNVTFGDNNKALFGNSSDLEIYHDGNNSRVEDSGTGGLRLIGSNFVSIQSSSGENKIVATSNASVALYHDNAKKIETNSGGATVTGTLIADGLVLGDSENIFFGNDLDARIFHDGANGTFRNDTGNLTLDVAGNIILDANGIALFGKTSSAFGTAGTEILNDGALLSTRNSGTVQFINRLTTDGEIISLSKDSSNIGTIGTFSDDLYIGNADVTLKFEDSADRIVPRGTGGAQRNGAISLGSPGNRFNNMYLGGQLKNDNNINASGDNFLVSTTNKDNGLYAYGIERNSDKYGFKLDGRIVANNLSTLTPGFSNLRLGNNAGINITSGARNVLVGDNAGDALTTGYNNVAIGQGALGSDTQGQQSIAIGRNALLNQNFSSGTDAYNVAVGASAGAAITQGIRNVLIGGLAGDAMNTARDNVAIGYLALSSETKGDNNVAIGSHALQSQLNSSNLDSYNVGIGYNAGNAITSGIRNTFVGGLAGDGTDDGVENVAVGYLALSANCGNHNVALGQESLTACTGAGNTAVGRAAGLAVTSGENNLMLGEDAGRTGSPGGNITTASNTIVLGDENIANAHIQVALTVASDERDKTDFTDLDVGLDFVKQLKPYTYKWDKRSKYGDKTADNYDLNAQTPDGTHKEDWLDVGFKAQEVEALEQSAGYDKANKTNLAVTISEDGKQYGMQYEKLIPILTKAIQELEARITALET